MLEDPAQEQGRIGGAMPVEQQVAQAVVATTGQPFLILDEDLRIEGVNRAFCKQFQVTAEEVEGKRLFDIGNGQWDIPELRRLLDEVLPN